jgi:hypothetical protein
VPQVAAGSVHVQAAAQPGPVAESAGPTQPSGTPLASMASASGRGSDSQQGLTQLQLPQQQQGGLTKHNSVAFSVEGCADSHRVRSCSWVSCLLAAPLACHLVLCSCHCHIKLMLSPWLKAACLHACLLCVQMSIELPPAPVQHMAAVASIIVDYQVGWEEGLQTHWQLPVQLETWPEAWHHEAPLHTSNYIPVVCPSAPA